MNRTHALAAIAALPTLLACSTAAAQRPLPIIDMHMHAATADYNGPPPIALCLPMVPNVPVVQRGTDWMDAFDRAVRNPTCDDPIWGAPTDSAVLHGTIAEMERLNVYGVLGGEPDRVLEWTRAAPGRFWPSAQFVLGRDDMDPDSLARLVRDAGFIALGEIANQYAGIAPNDPRMEPYWAAADELGIFIGIHIGEGPAGAAMLAPTYRASLSNPFLLEDVLAAHPSMRVSVMHYGSPNIEAMIGVLGAWPHVYVDLGGIQWFYGRDYFHHQLWQLVEAGFGKRILFGSDSMNWPGLLEPSIELVTSAPFLTEEQKRDILYHNAARFLGLDQATIDAHHGR